MPVNTIARTKLKEFKFRCEINGFEAALVQEFDPGKRTIASVEHSGAGQNHPDKEPGMMTYDPCVLRHVVPVDGVGRIYFETWMNECQDALTGNGLPVDQCRRNFSMYELDNEGHPVRVWEFKHAFPTGFTGGNRSALTLDQNVIDEIELTYISREVREI